MTLLEEGIGSADGHPTDITIKAEGKFTASMVRTEDAKAWVGKAAHTTISGINTQEHVVEATSETGEAEVPNPAGGDLFQGSESAEKSMTYRWTNPDEGSWTLLLAADGKTAAPTDVSVSWPGDTATPFSMPLIISGSLLLVAGIALALVRTPPRGGSKGDGRRAAGKSPKTGPLPDAGKSGPHTVAKVVATASVLALALVPSTPALAASQSPAPVDSSTQDTEQVFPVVMQQQLERILGEVSTSVAKADKTKNAKDLEDRTAGALKTLRGQNYKLRNDKIKLDGPSAIDTTVIRSAAVPTDDGAHFPRSLMVVTAKDSAASTIPTALTLTQAGPRDNYKVAFATPMLPGSTFPGIAVGDKSVKLLKDDAPGLELQPKDALSKLAGFMDNEKSKDADKFAKNAFLTLNAKDQNALVKANKDAKITFKRTVNDNDTIVMATPDGGALVSGNFTSTTTAKPKESGGTIGLDETTAKIVGVKETKKGIEISYGEPVLLYIPAEDSKDKVSVIAAEVITKDAKLLK